MFFEFDLWQSVATLTLVYVSGSESLIKLNSTKDKRRKHQVKNGSTESSKTKSSVLKTFGPFGPFGPSLENIQGNFVE